MEIFFKINTINNGKENCKNKTKSESGNHYASSNLGWMEVLMNSWDFTAF